MAAVGASHPGKTFLEISTLEEGSNRMFDDRPPEAVLSLISLIVNLLESVKVLIDQTPQVGCSRIADHRSALVPAVQCGQLGACGNHEKRANSGFREEIARTDQTRP